ncbi:hypothetical protein ES707_22146 [subsurface metagenome]
MLIKPTEIKKRGHRPVEYEYKVKDRYLVIMRPTQFGKPQLPEPKVPKFIGNFWLIEEYTSQKRHHSGQGMHTIWYKTLDSARECLERILEKNLDVPHKDWKTLELPEIVKDLEID